jgi:hypothetical protein
MGSTKLRRDINISSDTKNLPKIGGITFQDSTILVIYSGKMYPQGVT